jgi:hypothetical protein
MNFFDTDVCHSSLKSCLILMKNILIWFYVLYGECNQNATAAVEEYAARFSN